VAGDEGAETPEPEPVERDLDPDSDLGAILGAADRDRCPGARPVVSVSEVDDPDYLDDVRAWTRRAVTLERRGRHLGYLAELDDDLMFAPREPLQVWAQRFAESRPIVLHGALPDEVFEVGAPTAAAFERIGAARSLAPLLEARGAALGPDFRDLGAGLPLGGRVGDDARDVAAHTIGWREPDPEKPSRTRDDFWIKLQRLSDFEGDASMRVRVSFGREVDDDASRDLPGHRLVGKLAERLFPELEPLHRDEELRGLLHGWIKGRPLLTQSIAYWNAPGGGALMHHDAFDEPEEGRQRGVLYAQVTGATAWLAASTEDVIARLEEFAEFAREGALEDRARALYGGPERYAEFLQVCRSPERIRAELAQPTSAAIGPVLHGSPDFVALLADAGHAFVLEPGDVAVLPNGGLASTCMHSVFCASEEPGLAFSLAIREATAGGGHKGNVKAKGGRGRGGRGPRRRRRRGRRRPGSTR